MAESRDTEPQELGENPTEVFSVTELDEQIAAFVEETQALQDVRCIGEVMDLHQNSTALYFTLTEGEAELPCMIWANR